ncbi:IclR family transcriptional regulator C-terminal domain-containing protein [Streptomyces sp. NPDC059071]|uniref:IclR family transcriptional regulator domain-containing protein n=1 Tax=unclassified Streptomyces TaxID=2593676 RepID=UPI00365A4C6D
MTAVRRFNKDSGGRLAPEVAAGLLTLMDRLTGPADFWDRPEGDFGPLAHLYGLDTEARQRANSLYRLGSKALGRDELATAADWLGAAAAAGHPGALFRLALVALRAGEDWSDNAWFLIAEAARHGHGDASRLLAARAGRSSSANDSPAAEDEPFSEEVFNRLGMAHGLPRPASAPDLPEDALARSTAGEGTEAMPGRPGLVLVPAPALPTDFGPTSRTETGPVRPHLTALPGGLALNVPDLQPATARPAARALLPPSGETWWSPQALRPALLTDMARHSTAPAVVPARWQATQRARDMLLLVHESDGVDTRTLARRTRMPLHLVARLLDWLREERFVDTVAGAHFPGPLMDLATRADPDRTLLQDSLGRLRDELGAAVYISTYADGEITIQASASSDTAPPVVEVAPFSDAGHASANGKSLLAQLDFTSRMDHLTRYPSVALTGRTITSRRRLLAELDGPGPHSAQFDLFEYSDSELCVAYSLGLPGKASSLALSLPGHEHTRLIEAAETLSKRATSLLLAHLLGDDMRQTSNTQPREAWPHPTTARHALP